MTGKDTPEDAGGAAADAQDPKERFRVALEKKNAAAHRSAQGARNTGAVHGSEATGTGKRMFRRKAGG